MPSASVTMSVRLPEEDAEFIAGLEVSGAGTPSDKLRAIIRQARVRHEGADSYEGCLALVRDMLSPSKQRLAGAEHQLGVHSELVAAVAEAIPTLMAAVMQRTDRSGDNDADRDHLRNVENALADSVFNLIESVLRLGVTRQCRAYDPQAVSRRLDPVIEIAQVIQATRTTRKEQAS